MIRRLVPVVLLLASLWGCGKQGESGAAATVPPLAQVRLAVIMPGTGCRSDAPDWPAGARAYVQHLASRMDVPVQLCAVPDAAAAAKALAAGEVELARLDPASYAPVRSVVRPILAARTPIDLGRTAVVLAVGSASSLRELEDLGKARLVFAGHGPAQFTGPAATLASVGIPASAIAAASFADGPAATVAMLRADPGLAGALLSADWSRLCRGTAKDDRPCDGIRQLWRGRAQAASGWSARRDIPKESWARLVGIHVALYNENRPAAEWFAPGTTEIEPTEATALDPVPTAR